MENTSPLSATARAERALTTALVDTLQRAGFPGMAHLHEALPLKTQLVAGFAQEGVHGQYHEKTVALSAEDRKLIAAVSPGQGDSYEQASRAVGTFFHEVIHHRQDQFVGAPWHSAMEKHYEALINQVRASGQYSPSGHPAALARKYTDEAFARYAGERAALWMTTKATVTKLAASIHDPAELKAAIESQKAFFEKSIQYPGKSFGYINEFPSPWRPEFQLPEGPARAQIDAATGIPGSFEKAFPEYARLLQGAAAEVKP